MKILNNLNDFNQILSELLKNREKIGLVPTMGSIHEGHLSLLKKSKKLNYYSIVTIFVNPTQFNDLEDYNNYPKNEDRDIKVLKDNKCDLLFLPNVKDIYPEKVEINKNIDDFRDILCDRCRPGHFDGVVTVVDLLFKLIKPNAVFFGEKDFQQLKIIERYIKNNNLPILFYSCSSIRMSNGMSYSSRYNQFTNDDKKIFDKTSQLIYQHIRILNKNFNPKVIDNLVGEVSKLGIKKIDYFEVREESNLKISKNKNNSRLFVAFYINKVRVIDNFILY